MCTGFFGMIFGHAFKARYTTSRVESDLHHPPPAPGELDPLIETINANTDYTDGALDTIEKMYRNGNDVYEETYICDVCVRCGMVVRP